MPSLPAFPWSVDPRLLISVALFVGILLLVEGVFRFAAGTRLSSEARINRRLSMLASGTDPKQVLDILKRAPEKASGWARTAHHFVPFYSRIDALVSHAGLTIGTMRLLVNLTVLGVIVFLLFQMLFRYPLPLSVAVAVLVAVVLPYIWLRLRKRRRLKRFGEQLPEAIDIIVRSLRVGHPVTSAMGLVASELEDPIGSEFGIAVDEMTYGLGLKEAMANLSARVGLEDLRYMLVAINVQYGTGGNLAEVLEGLATLIRARFQMHRKILAVSAEGRLSAIVLTIFPFIPVIAISFISPNYYKSVADNPYFWPVAVLAFTMLVMNTVLMRWVTNFKV
jgi:tight adherence protein B